MNISSKRVINIVVLSILMSLASLHFLGDSNLSIEGLEFHVNTTLAFNGSTQIEIPPLGLIRAQTHDTPLKITIRLNNINLEQIQDILANEPNQNKIFKQVEQRLRWEVRRFVVELLLLAATAGLFSAFALRSSNLVEYLKAALVGVAVVGLLLFATYKDYNTEQFNNPEFEGALKAAPWMIGIAERTVAKIDTLSHKLQLVAQNFNELYQQIDNLNPIEATEGNIKVLHVSDIHNNPAAIQFIGRMSQLFSVNFILDTGDISDFGTPLEGLLLDRIADLSVPYLYIAGNHDSPDIISKMNEIDNVIVAENLVEFSGLRIMGFHDPASQTQEIEPPPPEVVAEHIDYINDFISSEVKDSGKPIDILALHSPYIAKPLAGTIPAVVFGHNHQYKVSQKNKSVLVNAGTSGASGLGTLQETKRRPYSVMLLHFNKTNNTTRLLAVDSIQVDSETGEFSMQRHLFAERKQPEENLINSLQESLDNENGE
ncbi:MAG: hypothetical protein FH758_00250 [Firmicutes bacterium]|nr:hypothetical protein [Bacillota bacterium]